MFVTIQGMLVDLKDYIENYRPSLVKKQLNNLNCKKGKNTFEHLMLDVLNKKADESLAEYIDTNNKHNPYGLHFKYKNSNNLNLCFSYQGFYTIFEISENTPS